MNHTLGVIFCLLSGLLYAAEAIIMAKARHLDNLLITHTFTVISSVLFAVVSINVETWSHVS